jgi:hypothetical protein
MVISKYNSREIVALINFFKNFSGDSYNLLGRWCHKGIPNCNESVIDKKIDFALLDNNLCTKVTKVTEPIILKTYKTINEKRVKI